MIRNIGSLHKEFKDLNIDFNISEEELKHSYFKMWVLIAKMKYLILRETNISYEYRKLSGGIGDTNKYLHRGSVFKINIIENNTIVIRKIIKLPHVTFFTLDIFIFQEFLEIIKEKYNETDIDIPDDSVPF